MVASFSETAAVAFVRKHDNVLYYTGSFSAELAVDAIPYGGSINATIANACLHAVRDSPLNDIIHMTIYFYKGCFAGPCDVEVRILRQSKTFQNVQVNIIQKGSHRAIAHLLVGRLPDAPLDPGVEPRTLTLTPSSSLYRRSPVSIHPSTAPIVEYPAHWHVIRSLRISHDPLYEDRNLAKTKLTRGDGSGVDMNGVLEDGRLMRFVHPNDKLDQATIAALADNFRPVIMLVPTPELPRLAPEKIDLYATMVATIEFKHRLPRSPSYSHKTIAMYSHGRFLTDGRGDLTAEIWSAPPGVVGDNTAVVEEGWRNKMVCLAVTTQMAIGLTARPHGPAVERLHVKSRL